ncbi:MAG: four helix bundle protein, partial [Clostridia bacterium]|nr:four helix bundle protein [Clostridia bacterium]
MNEKTIKELAIVLTVELTELCDSISAKSIYTNQLLRSCSSIGANAQEAKYAHSRADFISKLEISLKESYETEYWLEILYKVHSLSDEQYKSASDKCGKIRR